MKILPVQDIPAAQWEGYAAAHPRAALLHTPRWHQVMQNAYGFQVRTLAAVENNELCGLLPAYEVKTPFSRRIVSAPFGFYSNMLAASPAVTAELTAALRERAVRGNIRDIEIKSDEKLQGINTDAWIVSEPLVVSRLELEGSYDQARKKIKTRFQDKLRKAEREFESSSFVYREGSEEKDIAAFYELLVSLYKNKFYSLCQPFEFYRSLMCEFPSGTEVKLGLVEHNGKAVAGSLWFFWGKTAYFGWSAYQDAEAASDATLIIFRNMIRHACENGMKEVNFGISAPEMKGLIFFKERWGAVTQPLYFYQTQSRPASGYLSGLGARRAISFLPNSAVKVMNRILSPWFA